MTNKKSILLVAVKLCLAQSNEKTRESNQTNKQTKIQSSPISICSLSTFQVKTNFRTAITVPEKSWARFRDIFSDYCDKMKEGGSSIAGNQGSTGEGKGTSSGQTASSSPSSSSQQQQQQQPNSNNPNLDSPLIK